ncbi:MAG: protein phosphatase 2C domain-containing protein [Proteobacteria bacterium]|nr:protein phosphatase 2C domain-containing protein [Pseudomonadota bacterium]MBU1711036.1 protein phosphatase 2C domain-containing protein [Pseudomonadota bacterium]
MLDFIKKLFSPPPKPLASYGRTDTGRVRGHNEDAFCILPEQHVFLVADGMGGHNAGEVASRIAIEALTDYIINKAGKNLQGSNEEIRHALINGLRKANEKVMTLAASDDDLQGMGCTFVSCLVAGNSLHTCHVGDARCYIADEKKLEQITTDHTSLAKFDQKVRDDDMTMEIVPPPRHVVTRAIGFPFNEDPEYHTRNIRPGNRILLCSDGLWSMVDHDEMHRIITNAESPEQASNLLVDRANEGGGKDNITAVVVFID